MNTITSLSSNGVPLSLVKEFGPLDLFKTATTGLDLTLGTIDLKQPAQVYTTDLIDVSGADGFTLSYINVQTGTPNAATLLVTADIYSQSGTLLAPAMPIHTVTAGVVAGTANYYGSWGGASASGVKALGTSPGSIVTTGEVPLAWKAVSKIKLKFTVGTTATGTTSVVTIFFQAGS